MSSQTTTFKTAQQILGDSLLEIEVAGILGFRLDRKVIKQFQTVSFSVKELEQIGNRDLVLAAVPGQITLDSLVRFSTLSSNQLSYLTRFPQVARPGYHLFDLNGPVNMGFYAQKARLPFGFEVPYFVELAYLSVAWMKSGRERLFEGNLRYDFYAGLSLGGNKIIFDRDDHGGPDPSISLAASMYRPLVSK